MDTEITLRRQRNFLEDLIPILEGDIRWMEHWAYKKKSEREEVFKGVIAGTMSAKSTAEERLKEIEQCLR